MWREYKARHTEYVINEDGTETEVFLALGAAIFSKW